MQLKLFREMVENVNKITKVELRHYVRIRRTLFASNTLMILGYLMHYDTNSI